MSDDVRCDQCSKPGRRPRMHPAPPDWFFLESTVPSEIEGEPDDTVIVLACSAACRDAIWRIGPGPRWTYAEVEKGAAKVSLQHGRTLPKAMARRLARIEAALSDLTVEMSDALSGS